MKIKNDSPHYKKIHGKLVRPWRSVEVPDTELKPDSDNLLEKDIEKMTKDELLDYTALKGISADYSMTKSEIKKIIKNNEGD